MSDRYDVCRETGVTRPSLKISTDFGVTAVPGEGGDQSAVGVISGGVGGGFDLSFGCSEKNAFVDYVSLEWFGRGTGLLGRKKDSFVQAAHPGTISESADFQKSIAGFKSRAQFAIHGNRAFQIGPVASAAFNLIQSGDTFTPGITTFFGVGMTVANGVELDLGSEIMVNNGLEEVNGSSVLFMPSLQLSFNPGFYISEGNDLNVNAK